MLSYLLFTPTVTFQLTTLTNMSATYIALHKYVINSIKFAYFTHFLMVNTCLRLHQAKLESLKFRFVYEIN